MRPIFLFIFLALAADTTLAEPINVGVILPLTGGAASIGESCRNGILLAQEDNTDREIVSFNYENDELIPKNTVAAYNKLKNQSKLAAIVTVAAGPSNAIAPLAQVDQIPMIGVTNDSAILKNRDKVFLFWLPAEEQGKAIFKEAYARGYKNIASVTTTHQGALMVKKSFDDENLGRIKIIFEDEFSPEIQDFRTSIEKLRRRGPIDAIFVNLFIGQAGLFARQVRELGIQAPLFNGVIFENAAEVKMSNGALVGQWYVQIDEPKGKFIDRYAKRFPGAASVMSGNCYDIASLVIESKRADKDVGVYLKGVKDYEGAMGKFSVNDKNAFILPATVKIVTDSGFKKIGFTGESL